MKYYKVKPEFDQKQRFSKSGKGYSIFIANELYTERELKKIGALHYPYFDIVDIPKQKTHFFFGARFAITTAVATKEANTPPFMWKDSGGEQI